jgi:hypothetical protein
MQIGLIALATLAAAGTAFAQSSATISGSLSYGIQDSGAAGAKAVGTSLGGGANAININTTEDLGGGLRAGTHFEIRYNSATGDMATLGTGNSLFHNSNVFVGGGFGTVRAGKIAEANNCAFDPWGCTGVQGLAAGTAATLVGAQAQAQSVSYTTPTINGFSASFQSSQSTRKEERTAFNVVYSKGPILAQFLQTNNTPNSSADITVNAALAFTEAQATTALTTLEGVVVGAKAKSTSIGAAYNFGVARLSIVNAKTEGATGTVTADSTGLGLTVPMGATTLLAGYSKNSKAAANADTKMAIGANYALSKRTTIGADLFKNEALGASNGFTIRARHTF